MTRLLTQHLELWNDVWRCKGCNAQLTGSALTHPEDCPELVKLTAPAGGQGRGKAKPASEDA
jgi:hypothetical protein